MRAIGLVSILAIAGCAPAIKPPGVPTSGAAPSDHLLRTTSKVLYYVEEDYVDPSRVKPDVMLVAALTAIQDEIPEVQVAREKTDPGSDLVVRVGADTQALPSHPDSVDALAVELKDAFSFLLRRLPPETDWVTLERKAIESMLETLDPHSRLLSPMEFGEMHLAADPNFGGVGLVLEIRAGVLTVIAPLDDTPAAHAGILAGDRILEIGSQPTAGMTLDDAVRALRGPRGSALKLRIARIGVPQPIDVSTTREKIQIVNVEGQLLGDVAYVRVKAFQEGTADDVRAKLEHLRGQSPNGIRGLVLDLRNDPGGLLDEGLKLADAFLQSGPMITLKGQHLVDVRQASPIDGYLEVPTVVLINGGSAAASEIVATALKYRDRAVVLGGRTYGDASVQNLFDLRDGSALKLTIATFATPEGQSIQAVGVTPDVWTVPVRMASTFIRVGDPSASAEADLRRHLDADPRPPDHPMLSYPVLQGSDASAYLPSEVSNDEQVHLAAALLGSSGSLSRSQMLLRGAEVLHQDAIEKEKALVAAFAPIGVDWTAGADSGPGALDLAALLDSSSVAPGSELKLTVTVKNRGSARTRLRVVTRCGDAFLDRLEIPIGKLEKGKSATKSVSIPVPADGPYGATEIGFRLVQDEGASIAETTTKLTIRPPEPLPGPVTLDVKPKDGAYVTNSETLEIDGTAASTAGTKEVWVNVGGMKTFYQSFPEDTPASSSVSFATRIPLVSGQNDVVVTARNRKGERVVTSFTVLRAAP